MQSLCLIALFVSAFYDFGKDEVRLTVGLKSDLKKRLVAFIPSSTFVWTTLLFIYILVPYPWSEDLNYWFERMRIKLPLLLLPIAFYLHPKLEANHIGRLINGIVAVLGVFSLYVMYRYVTEFDQNVQLLKVGKSVYTPGNHIRFSVLSAFTILTSSHWMLKMRGSLARRDWLILGFGTLILLVTIHSISVRTGLLVLYIGIGILLLFHMIKQKLYKVGIGGILLMITLPFIMYQTSPAFKQKINYMLHDLKKYQSGEGHLYADSGRIVSFKAGTALWQDNPILGVGTGNARTKTKLAFAKDYAEYPETLMPHNQFIWVMMANGLLGLLLFLGGLVGPLVKERRIKGGFALSMLGATTVWLLFDHPFEGTVGVCIYLFFLYLAVAEREEEISITE